MGWTAFSFLGTRAAFVAQEFSKSEENGEVVDFAVVGSTIYMAYKIGTRSKEYAGKIVGKVIITSTNSKDYYNFRYKDMDEGMGPNESKCPARILNKLSPVNELYEEFCAEYAQNWRNRCIAYASEKKNQPKININTVVKVDHPLKFRGDMYEDTFQNVKGNLWRSVKHSFHTRFRMSRYKFEILKIA